MPQAPRRPCRQPGCPALVGRTDKGFCDQHRKKYMRDIDQRRGTATERGYSARWGRFRSAVLAERPLCEVCPAAAQEVHHSPPVDGPDDPRFFDPEAVVALCKSCHSAVTMKMLNDLRKA